MKTSLRGGVRYYPGGIYAVTFMSPLILAALFVHRWSTKHGSGAIPDWLYIAGVLLLAVCAYIMQKPGEKLFWYTHERYRQRTGCDDDKAYRHARALETVCGTIIVAAIVIVPIAAAFL